MKFRNGVSNRACLDGNFRLYDVCAREDVRQGDAMLEKVACFGMDTHISKYFRIIVMG